MARIEPQTRKTDVSLQLLKAPLSPASTDRLEEAERGGQGKEDAGLCLDVGRDARLLLGHAPEDGWVRRTESVRRDAHQAVGWVVKEDACGR